MIFYTALLCVSRAVLAPAWPAKAVINIAANNPKNTYNEYLDTLQKELPPLEIDGEMIDPKNDQNIDEEKTNRYIQELRQKIEESLGNEPPEFICKFAIITHTGMKIYVSEDKYKLINSEIDKSQNEKGEV